jgi:hypothetical protein
MFYALFAGDKTCFASSFRPSLCSKEGNSTEREYHMQARRLLQPVLAAKLNLVHKLKPRGVGFRLWFLYVLPGRFVSYDTVTTGHGPWLKALIGHRVVRVALGPGRRI